MAEAAEYGGSWCEAVPQASVPGAVPKCVAIPHVARIGQSNRTGHSKGKGRALSARVGSGGARLLPEFCGKKEKQCCWMMLACGISTW